MDTELAEKIAIINSKTNEEHLQQALQWLDDNRPAAGTPQYRGWRKLKVTVENRIRELKIYNNVLPEGFDIPEDT